VHKTDATLSAAAEGTEGIESTTSMIHVDEANILREHILDVICHRSFIQLQLYVKWQLIDYITLVIYLALAAAGAFICLLSRYAVVTGPIPLKSASVLIDSTYCLGI